MGTNLESALDMFVEEADGEMHGITDTITIVFVRLPIQRVLFSGSWVTL